MSTCEMTHSCVCVGSAYECVMYHIWMWHIHQIWMYITHSSVCDVSHMKVMHHTQMSHVTRRWVMTHIYESCHTQTSLVTYRWVMAHTNEVAWNSDLPVMCHIWICDVSRMNELHHTDMKWRASQTCLWCVTYECVMYHIWMCHASHMTEPCVTQINASRVKYECVMCHIWMRHVTRR